MGLTEASFAPSVKELFSKSLFIILHKCESTMLANSFTNFGGIVSGPVAFLMFMFFSNLFMTDTLALGILKVLKKYFKKSISDFFLFLEYFDAFRMS